jgi:hypothetical protein
MGCIISKHDFLQKSPQKVYKHNLELVYDDFTDNEYYSLKAYDKYMDKRPVHI